MLVAVIHVGLIIYFSGHNLFRWHFQLGFYCIPERRTIAELKEKWTDMKSVSQRIISARRYPKTGGGKKEKEPWFVDLVLDVLGVDTALVEGIAGKYD